MSHLDWNEDEEAEEQGETGETGELRLLLLLLSKVNAFALPTIPHDDHSAFDTLANNNLTASSRNSFEMPKRSRNNAVPSMEAIIEAYIGHLKAADQNFNERVVREMVRNFQRKIRPDDDNEETIYDELAAAYPLFGDPRTLYGDMYIPCSDTARIAAGSDKRARTTATDSTACSEAPLGTLSRLSAGLLIMAGDYVSVQADLSVGHHSHGGKGWVKAVAGAGSHLTVTVDYDASDSGCQQHSESRIPLSRLTILPTPSTQLPSRRAVQQSPTSSVNDSSVEAPELPNASQMTLRDALLDGYSRNRTKGWRARDLEFEGWSKLDFDSRFLLDLKELDGVISATSTNGSRRYVHKAHEVGGKLAGKFAKRKGTFDPLTIVYLGNAWGVGKNHAARVRKKGASELGLARKVHPDNPCRLSPIESLEAAKQRFTAKALFLQHHVKVCKSKNEALAYDSKKMKEMSHVWREEGKADWVMLDEAGKEVWEMQRRQKIARQPLIRDQIFASIRQDPTKSFDTISSDIDNWCSAASINKWMQSHDDYCKYQLD
jgi:hypothetical protein